METVYEAYQKQLLDHIQRNCYKNPISKATQKAYLETPRHLFVKRFPQWKINEWHEINDDNLEEHLAMLYADKPLALFTDDDGNILSTISQPTLVLRMLDMLQFEPGQTVFELGAGSGWNAALMGHLVRPEGSVYSLEIIPEVAQMAAKSIEQLGIKNVHIIEADGGKGYAAGAPYDRAIFTAGTYDLPRHFFEQMKENGLLLIVIKNKSSEDYLFLLRKRDVYFESVESVPCRFVEMTGQYQLTDLTPSTLEVLLEKVALKDKMIKKRPFRWGGRDKWQLRLSLILFLSIVEPIFRTFKAKRSNRRLREEDHFGLWDEENRSLVVAKDDYLISYGNSIAEERLIQHFKQWVELGMPGSTDFELKIYPIDYDLTAGENQWIVKRSESQFLWSLNR